MQGRDCHAPQVFRGHGMQPFPVSLCEVVGEIVEIIGTAQRARVLPVECGPFTFEHGSRFRIDDERRVRLRHPAVIRPFADIDASGRPPFVLRRRLQPRVKVPAATQCHGQ